MKRNKKRQVAAAGCLIVVLGGAAVGTVTAQETPKPAPSMSFFITSMGVGDGAALGGLAGADRHCQALASAVGAGGKTWRAYLSQQAADGAKAVNARDRIGKGPWHNFRGEAIAASVADLHSDNNRLTKATALDEKGGSVNGRGDTPNQHDILTGSTADGAAPSGDQNLTCRNWTSNGAGSALVGHHDRQGNGPTASSWNSAHPSRGCSQADLQGSGGAGLFYCFAAK